MQRWHQIRPDERPGEAVSLYDGAQHARHEVVLEPVGVVIIHMHFLCIRSRSRRRGLGPVGALSPHLAHDCSPLQGTQLRVSPLCYTYSYIFLSSVRVRGSEQPPRQRQHFTIRLRH